MIFLRTIIILLLGLAGVQPAMADTTIRTSSQFELPQSQTIEGNFLGVANPVSVSGEVTGDATLLGNQVTVTGVIGEDLLATGVLTRVTGLIQGDVRVISGNAVISGTVTGDVLVLSGSVEVLSDATIEGDLIIYGGTATVSGTVGGDILGATQSLTVAGPVAGKIDVYVGQLVLGNTASITESVEYTSYNLLSQNLETSIGGTVVRSDPVYASGNFSLGAAIYPMIILLFSTLVWYVLARRTLVRLVRHTALSLPRSAVTGVLSLFLVPLTAFVLAVGLLGGYLWIADISAYNSTAAFFIATLPVLIILFGFLTLLFLSVVAAPAFLGQLCLYVAKQGNSPVSVPAVLLGTVLSVVLLLLPVIGIFVFFFIVLIMLGGLLEQVVKLTR